MTRPVHLDEFRWVNSGQVAGWGKANRPDGRKWTGTVHRPGCHRLGANAVQLDLDRVNALELQTCRQCGGDGMPIRSPSASKDAVPQKLALAAEPEVTVEPEAMDELEQVPLDLAEPPAVAADVTECLERLASSPRYPLRELLQHPVPKTTGIYALWRDTELLYVGISTRVPTDTVNRRAAGVQGRLRTYYDAWPTADFVLSVVLRYLVPGFSAEQLEAMGRGALGKNEIRSIVRVWLYEHVDLQAVTADAKTAAAAERVAMRYGIGDFGPPLLNGGGRTK